MAVLNQPNDYDTFTNYPNTISNNHDAIFIFVETLEEMVKHATYLAEQEDILVEKGYVFFAYPKKGNTRYPTYIHRDEMFPALRVDEDGYIGKSTLKFSRMVSMDDVFTVVGLKRERRKTKKSTAASQCVADYEDKVVDIEEILANYPKLLTFYQSLTPGYRKDWARYIFSAKQQKTRDNRIEQMLDILSQGYKSVDLYRMKKK